MSHHDRQGPEGELRLYYENEESASTHRDQGRKAILQPAEGDSVKLVLESWDKVASKASSDRTKKEYKISVADLIRLIDEHGKQIR